jgi:hypothetical protein
MKRACYEWGAIALTCVSLACLGCWAGSKLSKAFDHRFDFGPHSFGAIEGGAVSWSNFSEFQYLYWAADQGSNDDDHSFAFPGFQYRRVKWDRTYTYPVDCIGVQCSLLLPGMMAMILSAVCFWRFRRQFSLAPKAQDTQKA